MGHFREDRAHPQGLHAEAALEQHGVSAEDMIRQLEAAGAAPPSGSGVLAEATAAALLSGSTAAGLSLY